MYNLSIESIGKQLNFYRKKQNISLEELGKRISKSKATVSKYEKGDILPDILTLLEICNVLNIDISQILEQKISKDIQKNPFKHNSLFLYYITNKKIIMSIIEINECDEKLEINFYNDIKKSKNDCAYFYKGYLDYDSSTAYIHLNNKCANTTKLEHVDIVISIPWNNNFTACKYFLLGLTPNGLPVVKRGIISKNQLSVEEFKKYMDILTISKLETKEILNDNMWILKNKDYYEF